MEIYDHADNEFWLGKRVADVLVAFGPSQAYVSRRLRKYGGRLTIIPLTTDLGDGSVPRSDRAGAKQSTLSLSIGSPWKIVPDGFWNYFAVMREILERNRTHTHTLLTKPDKCVTEILRSWPESLRGRIIVKYGVTDPASHYRQADFLIETFPFSGGQVRIEAMALGLPVIFVRNSHFSHVFSHSGIDALPGSYPFIADSNNDVTTHADVLIRHLDMRRKYGEFLRAMFQRDFSPEVVHSKLEGLVEGTGIPDWADSFSTMAGKVHIDDDYLLSSDLTRGPVPSPFLLVGRHVLRHDKLRFRVLLECLSKLMVEDWLWSLKHLAHPVRMASPDGR